METQLLSAGPRPLSCSFQRGLLPTQNPLSGWAFLATHMTDTYESGRGLAVWEHTESALRAQPPGLREAPWALLGAVVTWPAVVGAGPCLQAWFRRMGKPSL